MMNETWICGCGQCMHEPAKFCSECGTPRPAQSAAMNMDTNLGVAMFAILRDAQAMTSISEGVAYLTRAAQLAAKKARELLCKPLDREGLAKALQSVLQKARLAGWDIPHDSDGWDAQLADAAIAYLGARPAVAETVPLVVSAKVKGDPDQLYIDAGCDSYIVRCKPASRAAAIAKLLTEATMPAERPAVEAKCPGGHDCEGKFVPPPPAPVKLPRLETPLVESATATRRLRKTSSKA